MYPNNRHKVHQDCKSHLRASSFSGETETGGSQGRQLAPSAVKEILVAKELLLIT